MEVVVSAVCELSPDALAPLVAEGERAGWRFVRRLADDLRSGANRFDQPGELLFVAEAGGAVVGVCGLNADPYSSAPAVGRVRRLYVLASHRGGGVGQRLVQAVVSAAAGRFCRLRVRTENAAAGRMYERLGFTRIEGDTDCTHALELADIAPGVACDAVRDTRS